MIGGIGRVEILELAVAPIVVTAIHDHTANRGAMSADELGGAMGDDVRAPLERAAEIGCGKRIVDEQNLLVLLCDFRHFLKRKHCQVRVA